MNCIAFINFTNQFCTLGGWIAWTSFEMKIKHFWEKKNTLSFVVSMTEHKKGKKEVLKETNIKIENEKVLQHRWSSYEESDTFQFSWKMNESYNWKKKKKVVLLSYWRHHMQASLQRWGGYSLAQSGRGGRWSRLLWPCRTMPGLPAGTAGSGAPWCAGAVGWAWGALEGRRYGCPPQTQRDTWHHALPYLTWSVFNQGCPWSETILKEIPAAQLRGCSDKRRLSTPETSSNVGGIVCGWFKSRWLRA